MGGIMKQFLTSNAVSKSSASKLLVADKVSRAGEPLCSCVDAVLPDQILAGDVQRSLGIACDVSSFAQETQRLIRSQFASLVPNMDDANLTQMNLGLSHSLSRYKIKFSPDKVDTMIVQAVALLDDIDKEVRNIANRSPRVC